MIKEDLFMNYKLFNCTLVGKGSNEYLDCEIERDENYESVHGIRVKNQKLFFIYESLQFEGKGAIEATLNENVYPYDELIVGEKYIVFLTDSNVTHIEHYKPDALLDYFESQYDGLEFDFSGGNKDVDDKK